MSGAASPSAPPVGGTPGVTGGSTDSVSSTLATIGTDVTIATGVYNGLKQIFGGSGSSAPNASGTQVPPAQQTVFGMPVTIFAIVAVLVVILVVLLILRQTQRR